MNFILLNDYNSWEQIQFGKNIDYDYTPDMVGLSSEFYVKVGNAVWSLWFSHLYGKDPPPSSFETRVILAYLKSHPDDLKQTIQERENQDYREEDDHIALVSGKECELKWGSGRGFTINKGCYNRPMSSILDQRSLSMFQSRLIAKLLRWSDSWTKWKGF